MVREVEVKLEKISFLERETAEVHSLFSLDNHFETRTNEHPTLKNQLLCQLNVLAVTDHVHKHIDRL